ncbi:MAG: DUF5615 family PIN-like protein [Cyanobacteria bacterium P01_G01_bin.54]
MDENVNPAIAAGLRRAGIDVKTTQDAEYLGVDDRNQLMLARQEIRVIVTHDDDFLILASQGLEHAGIAYCRKGARSLGEIIHILVWVHPTFAHRDCVSLIPPPLLPFW